MPNRRCLNCGTRQSHGTYCRDCTRRNGSTREWRKIRAQILERDHHRCTWRGPAGQCPNRSQLHVDHVQPLADGGTNDPSNLRTLCQHHHAERHGARAERAHKCFTCKTASVPHNGLRCPACRASAGL